MGQSKKECSTCGERKPVDEFYKTDKALCKECKKRYARNRYHTQKIQALEEDEKYAQKLEERISELENRLANLEILDQKVAKLKKRVARLEVATVHDGL